MTMPQPKPHEGPVLRLSRSFAAPRERVFRAFTAPSQMVKWWGPKDWTVPACTMDARAGGAWHTVMRSPEGKDHIVSGVYREVLPPERLIFTWAWEADGARGHETVVTIELLETPGRHAAGADPGAVRKRARPRPARRRLVEQPGLPGGGPGRGRDRLRAVGPTLGRAQSDQLRPRRARTRLRASPLSRSLT